jgi:hypothetical protein
VNPEKQNPSMKHEIKLENPSSPEEKKEKLSSLFHTLLKSSDSPKVTNWPGKFPERDFERMVAEFEGYTFQGFVHATLWLPTKSSDTLSGDNFKKLVKKALDALMKGDYPYLAVAAYWDYKLQARSVHIIAATLDKDKKNTWKPPKDISQRWEHIGDWVAKQLDKEHPHQTQEATQSQPDTPPAQSQTSRTKSNRDERASSPNNSSSDKTQDATRSQPGTDSAQSRKNRTKHWGPIDWVRKKFEKKNERPRQTQKATQSQPKTGTTQAQSQTNHAESQGDKPAASPNNSSTDASQAGLNAETGGKNADNTVDSLFDGLRQSVNPNELGNDMRDWFIEGLRRAIVPSKLLEYLQQNKIAISQSADSIHETHQDIQAVIRKTLSDLSGSAKQPSKDNSYNKWFAWQLLKHLKENNLKLIISNRWFFSNEIKYGLLNTPIKEAELGNGYSLKDICKPKEQQWGNRFSYAKVLKYLKAFGLKKESRFSKLSIPTVLLVLGIAVFWFWDKTIQIKLPDNLSNSEVSNSAWAYDDLEQPCELAKILSSDSPIYTIDCKNRRWRWPYRWGANTLLLSGYEPIDLKSLQKDDNGYYQVSELKPVTEWRVFFNGKELPFQRNTKVWFFDSKDECEINQNPHQKWLLYTKPEALSQLPPVEKQPHWAKVFRGNQELSNCANGKPSLQQKQFYITFEFKPKEFTGKRKVVVIAPSQQLAHNGIGRAIRKTLTEWFSDIRSEQVPVSILLINEEGAVNSLIRSEDLASLPQTGPNSITAKVDNIQFRSDSFRSLYELQQVNDFLEGKDFDRVLYLTDSDSLSAEQEIDLSLLGVPWGWRDKGISLSVLTLSECEKWRTQAKVTECQTLDKKTAKQRLSQMLNTLLDYRH